MTRNCTHCGKELTGKRRTCSRVCMRQRHRAGGVAGNVAQKAAGANWWTPRGCGDARTIQTEHGLEVLDPVALAAQGVVMVDAWGRPWEPIDFPIGVPPSKSHKRAGAA